MKHNIRDSKGRFTRACKEPEKVYMRGFKGFNKGLICKGKQYKENTVFEEPEAVMCEKGMHFCENPLDVFRYYPPCDGNEYAQVEALAPCNTKDNKSCTTKLRIKAKISFEELCKAAVDFALNRIDKKQQQHIVGSTVASSISANTGYRSVATNTGYRSVATNTGDWSVATNTGYRSVATNTGDWSVATNTGYRSASAVTGNESFAVSTGIDGRVKGAIGCFLACAEWEMDDKGEWHPIRFISAMVDGVKIKPDTWYRAKDGKLVEVKYG